MSVSLSEVTSVTGAELDELSLLHIMNGTTLCGLGPSGTSKTFRQRKLEASINEIMIDSWPRFAGQNAERVEQGRPKLNGCTGMIMSAPAYDEYKLPGLDIPTTVRMSAEEAQETMGNAPWLSDVVTLGTSAQPVYFAELMYLARNNPDHIIRVGIDEINAAVPMMQSQILQLISEHRIGNWVIPKEVSDRLSFYLLGNRPEDNPSDFTFIGPLAHRVWSYQLVLTASEFLDHLDSVGKGNPWVHTVLKEHPQLLFVNGVGENGEVPGLSGLTGNADDQTVAPEFDQPVINGLSPRGWTQIAEMMNNCDAMGVNVKQQLMAISGRAPKAVIEAVRVATKLAENFSTLEQVLDNPSGARLPKQPLLQSMQVRYLLPQLRRMNEKDLASLKVYLARFNESTMATFVDLVATASENTSDPQWTRIANLLIAEYSAQFIATLQRVSK